MSKLIIGTAGKQMIVLDLDLLLSTRMLVTADSGGGKTFLLKRICEQASSKIQIIIIDPEGEFSPLRERFPFVLAGKGGETPADVRSAQKLGLTLLQTRASAVCDLYEMKSSERHQWVRLFLEALLEAPKNLRHPCIVIVDEAHLFCPEKGKGESEASDAMKGLCTRGRKRLLCPLFATQRLAELDKGASGMLNNRLIGPTFEDVNRKRAAEILSVVSEEMPKFKKEIQMLEPGYFYALGRAICKERTLLRVGSIETPHGEEARKYELEPPPPPEKIKALLPKLADLPKAAEEEARSVAQFRKEIRELKSQLRAQPKAAAMNRGATQAKPEAADPKAIERQARALLAGAERQFAAELEARDKILKQGQALSRELHATISKLAAALNVSLPKPAKIALPKITATPAIIETPPNEKGRASWASRPQGRRESGPAAPPSIDDGELTGPERKILKALGQLSSIGKDAPSKNMAAAWAGYSPQGGAFTNPLGALRTKGLLDYPAPGNVALTATGRMAAGPCEPPPLAPIWLGVSVEDQATADERIPLLLQTPAAVHWISAEPLLGPIDLRPWLTVTKQRNRMLDWVVVGGESGPGARPMDVQDWAYPIVQQCQAAGVPVFVKQLGSRPICGGIPVKISSRKGGELKEMPGYLRVRQFPGARA
jgi:hypothetical protein